MITTTTIVVLIVASIITVIMVGWYRHPREEEERFVATAGPYGNHWAPTLPENLDGANARPHGRELNSHDFEAAQERKVDPDGTPINSWYETKDVSLVQDPILHKDNWDYLQGGDYYEYWYNKPWMTFERYQDAVENKRLQESLSGNQDRFPRTYCNYGWYEANTCGGLPAYEGTYLYGEANSVGHRIVPPDSDDDEEEEEFRYTGRVEPIETTGCADML